LRAGARQDEEHLIDDTALRAVGALLRCHHDAVAGYDPSAAAAGFEEGPRARAPGQLVCHGDVAPRNTVFRDRLPVAFIDWDGAWISDPLWDVGYACGSSSRCGPTAGCGRPAGRRSRTGWPGPQRWPTATGSAAMPGGRCPRSSPR
jgi:Phosphotransferase enzyme family